MSAKSKSRKKETTKVNPPQKTILKQELETRFLSYALSTIVSRALPDVRDGLKPVHRRVLYSMNQLRLGHDAKFRKSATVVGDVIGKYHPHGDQAAYDTMVRLAQDFSLRYPLIEGQGNFGNIDGDPAAAMRYTEARLTRLAGELLADLKKETVDFVPTYDSTQMEPRLMPARFPNLMVNGSSGIAVGIATNIPPHNMTETMKALIDLVDKPKLETKDLLKHIKGPDFPTGGQLLASKSDLLGVYESGRGPLKVRGEWVTESIGRGKWHIIITSIPYSVNKTSLIEKIADLIISKKLQAIVDIRDESTEDIRVVLEPKSQTVEADKVMAYIFKHTDLQVNFAVNMTALTPESKPLRHSLRQMLKSFLDFRYKTTQKRLTYELRIIEERLHILSALAKVYKSLDEAIAIIRKSKIRDDAKNGLIQRFKLDETQANAILDLRLSALVGLEISRIRKDKAEKEAEREIIRGVLGSKARLWKLVRKELVLILDTYGDNRKTKVIASIGAEQEYSAEDFIDHEDTHVIVSGDGWVRRARNVASPDTLRFKNGDSLLSLIPVNTRDIVCFFTSAGKVYGLRALDITQTTGFGDPIQSIFKFADKERVISVIGFAQPDSMGAAPKAANDRAQPSQGALFGGRADDKSARAYGETIGQGDELLIVTESGMGFKIGSDSLGETNKNGRKIANLKGDDALFGVNLITGGLLFTLSSDGRGLLCKLKEVPLLSGAGAGARLMKIKPGARLLGFKVVDKNDKVTLIYLNGKDNTIKISSLDKGARGTVGRVVGARRKKLLVLAKG
ncbi:DNA gyrase subunit A [hydrothermal vent metagenome]|uniref:DNA topoisomerase (ATP-hydrolyzing) n=1 Tax=hydrothermal vent metagenome TaxID=652676 RepID=A0A3B1CGP1_9ZZZZ